MEQADAYLRHTYGDYMTLPAEESRKTHYKLIMKTRVEYRKNEGETE